jgi:hypothetical protein
MVGRSSNREKMCGAAVAAGFLGAMAGERHGPAVDRRIDITLTVLNKPGAFDFGDRSFVAALPEEPS